jgi:outer membrane protein assembly factor BamB
VVWKDRLFVACAADEGTKRVLVCLRTEDGRIDWSRSYEHATHSKHQYNSYASSTPAVDAERVYAIMGSVDCRLRAFSHEGAELWDADLGKFAGNHGQGSSPIVIEGMVIVAQEHEANAFVAAYDAGTGKARWKTPRRSGESAAYGTPCVVQPPGEKAQVVFLSQAHGLSSVDALTGEPLWEAPVFDKRTTSSPVLGQGLVYGTCGSGAGGNFLVALRLGGKGDVSKTHVAYEIRNSAPYVPTPVVKGDLLFLWNAQGIVTCADAATGKIHWRERVGGGQYFSSPVCVDDRLFSISERGEVVAISATEEFKVLGRSALGEESHSTPTVAGGRMYLRTLTHVISVGGQAPKKARAASAGS